MGQSTNAYVWFGLCWTEADEDYYERGLPEVVVAFLKEKVIPTLSEEEQEEFEDELGDNGYDYEAVEELAEKILNEHGCEFVRHCSGDYTMLGVTLKGMKQFASRGEPQQLDLAELQKLDTAVAVETLRKGCEAIGWPWKDPKWWLASMWN